MKHLIATMESDELSKLIEQAINEGCNVSPNHDPDRICAEAWLRGWCDERATPSFEEAVVIFLHNYIMV